MPGLLPNVDPDGLLEYSVVYTDRALNHMSRAFQQVMRDISESLKAVYGAESAVVVPGSGTFGMESVARQFATGKKCLVLRNGWFSYRWSQILEMGEMPSDTIVMKARQVQEGSQAPFAPAPIEEVLATIAAEKPVVRSMALKPFSNNSRAFRGASSMGTSGNVRLSSSCRGQGYENDFPVAIAYFSPSDPDALNEEVRASWAINR